jgi:hypothetical protein
MKGTIPVQETSPRISLRSQGDLEVTGWGRQEIQYEIDHDDRIEESREKDGFSLVCRGDCILYLPENSILEIDRVHGDAMVHRIKGTVTLRSVDGDLEVEDVGLCTLGGVAGDGSIHHVQGGLVFRHVSGDLDIEAIAGDVVGETVDGDCSISDVEGTVVINRVNGDIVLENTGSATAHQINGDFDFKAIDGDLKVRSVNGDVSGERLAGGFTADTVRGDLSLLNLEGAFQAHVGGDAQISLSVPLSEESTIHAGNDISLAYPGDGNATLEIGSGDGRIVLDTPGHKELIRSTTHRVVLGSGAARVTLRAGGQVRVTSQSWEARREVRPSIENLGEEIFNQVSQEPGKINIQVPEVKVHEERIKASSRKIEDRLAEARRKLEQRSRQIAARFGGRVPWPQTSEEKPVPSPDLDAEPAQKVEPVTEDERLIILRMVQEKKITIDEAEQLLATLDEFDEQSRM